MRFPRFLAAGVVVSLALHGTGSAFFAKDPDEVSIAASEGGGVSVIGSIEDLVAGAQVEKVTDTPPVEEVDPLDEPVEPVKMPVAIAKPVQETPVRPVEVKPVLPVAEPISVEVTAQSSEAVPVAEGVTLADPVTAAPADAVLPEVLPQTRPAPVEEVKPVEPVNEVQPEPLPDQKPVEIASVVPTESPELTEPVKLQTELLEAVPDPLQDVTETPRTKPEPPVRKTEPRKTPEKTKRPRGRARKPVPGKAASASPARPHARMPTGVQTPRRTMEAPRRPPTTRARSPRNCAGPNAIPRKQGGKDWMQRSWSPSRLRPMDRFRVSA